MAGGHYAAVYVNSAAWTPKWKSTCTEYPDKKYWELEIVIPFSELGETPKAGDKWLLIVNRNHRSGATSYPCRAYHDMAKAGEIVF